MSDFTWVGCDNYVHPRVFGPVMTYDATRQVVVLYQGRRAGGVWEWNGTWTKISVPKGSPGPADLVGFSLNYHAGLGKTLLFGGVECFGTENPKPQNALWSWDGQKWHELSPSLPGRIGPGPAPRYRHSSAYDPDHHQLLIYGGIDHPSNTGFSDLWALVPANGGAAWVQKSSSSPPGDKIGHAMVYDAAHHALLLCGVDGIMWLWNGQWSGPISWLQRMRPGLVYDDANQRVILFGGDDHAGPSTVFVWDGMQFQAQSTYGAPRSRQAPAMAYDAARGYVLMCGGAMLEVDAEKFIPPSPPGWDPFKEPPSDEFYQPDPCGFPVLTFGHWIALADTWKLLPWMVITEHNSSAPQEPNLPVFIPKKEPLPPCDPLEPIDDVGRETAAADPSLIKR